MRERPSKKLKIDRRRGSGNTKNNAATTNASSVDDEESVRREPESDTNTLEELESTPERNTKQDSEKMKEEFERMRDEILEQLPNSYKNRFGDIGFGRFGKAFFPAMIVSPYDAPSGEPGYVRDKWMGMFEKLKQQGRIESLTFLVFWYGTDLGSCYGFVPQKDFVTYKVGQQKSYDKTCLKLLEKHKDGKPLTNPEQEKAKGYEEMMSDLALEQQDRNRKKLEFEELHETVDVDEESMSETPTNQLSSPSPSPPPKLKQRRRSSFNTDTDQANRPKKRVKRALEADDVPSDDSYVKISDEAKKKRGRKPQNGADKPARNRSAKNKPRETVEEAADDEVAGVPKRQGVTGASERLVDASGNEGNVGATNFKIQRKKKKKALDRDEATEEKAKMSDCVQERDGQTAEPPLIESAIMSPKMMQDSQDVDRVGDFGDAEEGDLDDDPEKDEDFTFGDNVDSGVDEAPREKQRKPKKSGRKGQGRTKVKAGAQETQGETGVSETMVDAWDGEDNAGVTSKRKKNKMDRNGNKSSKKKKVPFGAPERDGQGVDTYLVENAMSTKTMQDSQNVGRVGDFGDAEEGDSEDDREKDEEFTFGDDVDSGVDEDFSKGGLAPREKQRKPKKTARKGQGRTKVKAEAQEAQGETGVSEKLVVTWDDEDNAGATSKRKKNKMDRNGNNSTKKKKKVSSGAPERDGQGVDTYLVENAMSTKTMQDSQNVGRVGDFGDADEGDSEDDREKDGDFTHDNDAGIAGSERKSMKTGRVGRASTTDKPPASKQLPEDLPMKDDLARSRNDHISSSMKEEAIDLMRCNKNVRRLLNKWERALEEEDFDAINCIFEELASSALQGFSGKVIKEHFQTPMKDTKAILDKAHQDGLLEKWETIRVKMKTICKQKKDLPEDMKALDRSKPVSEVANDKPADNSSMCVPRSPQVKLDDSATANMEAALVGEQKPESAETREIDNRRPNNDISKPHIPKKVQLKKEELKEGKPVVTAAARTVAKPPVRKKFTLGRLGQMIQREQMQDMSKPASTAQQPSLPAWLVGPCKAEVPANNDDRRTAIIFLRDMASQFPSGKIDVDSTSLSLEKAIFEWANKVTRVVDVGTVNGNPEDSKPMPAIWTDIYWNRVHTVVAGVCGKKDSGTLMHHILNGAFETPSKLVQLKKETFGKAFTGQRLEESDFKID